MIVWIIYFIISIKHTTAEHFNGGTIRWKPIDPNSNSSTVVITITQRYSWVASKINCNVNVPITTIGYSTAKANLTCVDGCSKDGGYSRNSISILTDCETVSPSLDIMTSERSTNVTLTTDALFTIVYKSGGWRTLENFKGSSADWSLASLIDLRRRQDGSLNTPPEPSIISPQFVVVNETKKIQIPFRDINKGDDVRCRWAENKY